MGSKSELMLELGRFVERMSAIARTGLAFKPDGYDAERYEELLKETSRLAATLSAADDVGAEEIRRRWRESVVSGYDGYVTVAVGVGALVFNRRHDVLMMKRTNGRWWYPTGFCEVGVSPAENVIKEVREELGLTVRPLRLMAVIDSLKAGSAARHIYSMLFECEVEEGEIIPNPLEALDAAFYPIERLPEPLHGVDRKWIAIAREFRLQGRIDPYFDPV